MELQAQTELISAVVALAIAIGAGLRTPRRQLQWLFVAFAINVALWYLAQSLLHRTRDNDPVWSRAVALIALALPQAGIRFLRAFVVDEPGGRRSRLLQVSWLLGVPLAALALSPLHAHPLARGAVSVYVVGLFSTLVVELAERARRAESRLERIRARYMVGIASATTLVFLTYLLPYAGLNVGPIGSALVLVVLFLLSQVMARSRLIDLYELSARLISLTLLAFILAGIYYVLVDWTAGPAPYVLNAIVASLVILILFDPVRTRIEEQIGRFFFRERFDLEKSIAGVRQRLAHVLELEAAGQVVLEGLEASRRITHASIYLLDAERRGFDLFVHMGPAPLERLDNITARPMLERISAQGSLVVGVLRREADERRENGELREAAVLEEVLTLCARLEAAVVLPVESSDGVLLGLLCLRDDRARDAFSLDEVAVLRELAVQLALAIENSEQHGRIKERDRLAALGEMSAGLAHEIRNPLGSIQAAAQLLEGTAAGPAEREYLGIILEEVGRLNRVVGSFLDYGRPRHGQAALVDVNDAVDRTVAILRKDLPQGVELELQLAPRLAPVRIDPEHLRQVVMNLVRNAAEAMEGNGSIHVVTQLRSAPSELVEILVRDTGPGIAAKHLPSLFVPFFSTKAQGTGLGLAISQRLIASAGGRIEVRTQGGRGTTFVIVLPPGKEEGA